MRESFSDVSDACNGSRSHFDSAVADVGCGVFREAAQMAVVRDFSRTTSTSSSSTMILNEVELFPASEGACAARARTRRPSSHPGDHVLTMCTCIST